MKRKNDKYRSCSKKRFRSADEAYAALRNIAQLPKAEREERTEQDVYRCNRHTKPVWHLTSWKNGRPPG